MDNPEIGALRWRVMLALETETQNVEDAGSTVAFDDVRYVYANIEPVGTATYMLGTQTDIDAITHRITIRYQPALTEFHFIFRDRIHPDGTTITEKYRIHRLAEINGRQRYLSLDCEML